MRIWYYKRAKERLADTVYRQAFDMFIFLTFLKLQIH